MINRQISGTIIEAPSPAFDTIGHNEAGKQSSPRKTGLTLHSKSSNLISQNNGSPSHKRSESEQVLQAHEDSNANLLAFHSALNIRRTKSKDRIGDQTVSNGQTMGESKQ